MTGQSKDSERLAELLEKVADGELHADEAIRALETEPWADSVPWDLELFDSAYHWLQHFAIDRDIRERDQAYACRQIGALHKIAAQLRSL
jgi:hypothetical protein